MTVAEFAAVLQPPVTEDRLRAMIKVAAIMPAQWRRTGKQGHPHPEYDYAAVARLHAALTPWLARDSSG
jgi:hypothetical protein